mmetsp:Transcript_5353/g.8840  ORF Transcript_5353/g.8840 Transcript_5353/m.8840 type:complete len:140 (-) Transcript_5353:252-671(-)
MNIGVATTVAIVYTADSAASHGIFIVNAALTPDFVDTAIIFAASFGDAVTASINFTTRTYPEIHAVYTHHIITALAPRQRLTVQAVQPFALATPMGHKVRTVIFTLKTVLLHATITIVFLSSISFVASSYMQHRIVRVV